MSRRHSASRAATAPDSRAVRASALIVRTHVLTCRTVFSFLDCFRDAIGTRPRGEDPRPPVSPPAGGVRGTPRACYPVITDPRPPGALRAAPARAPTAPPGFRPPLRAR